MPDIVETFPNVQIRAVRGAVLLPRFGEKGQRAHNKRCILLQSWRLGDFFLFIGAHLVKKNCFIKSAMLSNRRFFSVICFGIIKMSAFEWYAS